MAKSNYKKMTSPKGEALYPHLKQPETYEGSVIGYTIQVKFSEEDTAELLRVLEAELDEAKNSPQFKDKKWLKEPRLGAKEDADGNIIFKFKTKHEFKNQDGEIVKREVPIFDSKGSRIDVNIGNGSIVRVAFSIVPYHKSSTNNGITLYLDAIQVIDLVEYSGGGSASSYGFGVENGYVADVENEGDDDVPF